MNKILFALAVAIGASAVAPALADTIYYGTADRTTISPEQNNADASAMSARTPTQSARTATLSKTPRVYGYAVPAGAMDVAQPPSKKANGSYLGTSWRYHDNADARIR